ncbi:MAG: hypothetical protein RL409_2457 [Gemmatimonadota bacterium]|jgi:hypothetical protein
MPLIGTLTTTTSGAAVSFGTPASTSGGTNLEFRARTIALNNIGVGGLYLDIHTTSGNSTGWTLAGNTSFTFTELGGARGFSIIASTAASTATVSYMASR